MSRRVVITGLGPASGLGLGIDETWQKVLAGHCVIERIKAFDPSRFDCQIASEITQAFVIRDYVPKSYRKATKVMARDIEIAVAAADLAAKDAKLKTKSTSPEGPVDYEPFQLGVHIGAGLIAADLNELTAALAEAKFNEGPQIGKFDMHKWGSHGMEQLTPLWLLKYLPNMLACHVTIIHDAQGPSNTITCAEASSGLSIGESLRVIQRNAADACICGGTESKLNPMAFLRQEFTARLICTCNADPANAVRPFDENAGGMVIGEGGAIVILESLDCFEKRKAASSDAADAYAEVIGFSSSQTINPAKKNREPDIEGRAIATAIKSAMAEAGTHPEEIDLIVPMGSGIPTWDMAELAAMRNVFGNRLSDIPVLCPKSLVGNCGAGAGGLDVCITAKAIAEQTIPPIVNRDQPRDGIGKGTREARQVTIRYALTFTSGYGGQNTAMVFKRI